MFFRTSIFSKNFLKPEYTFSISTKYGLDIEKAFVASFLLESGTLQSLVLSQQTFVLMKTSRRRFLSSSSEDVFKASSRRLDQDKYIRLSHTSSEYVFKMSSRCFDQDEYIRVGHTSSRRLQNVFKTFSRRLQDVFKTSCKSVFKTY